MKRYEYYRETASPVLKEVPSHWEDTRIGRGYAEKSIGNNDGEQLLSVFLNRGVVSYTDTDMKQVHKPSEDMSSYQLVEPGDFVLNNQQAWRGSVGVSSYRGIVSPAYIVMTPIMDNNPRFMNYMLRETACTAQFVLASKGVGSIQRILSPIKLKSSIMVLPPRAEQDQIVRYLDWQVSKINRLIAAKRKEIELLEATTAHYLENTIHKGIRNEQLVETGNPWINTAPKSWKKVRHKNVLTEKKEVVGENYSQYTLLSLTTKGVIIRDTSSGKGKYPSDFSTYQAVNPFDMVFCLFDVDETPRTVGLSTRTGMITGAYTVYETHDALPEYLLYYFLSIDNKKGFKPLYSGLRKVIGKDVFSRQAIYLPSIEEQKEIVDAIQIRQAKSRNAIDLLEREIESLHDLRTRLISDVVTGQVDVRGIEVPEFEYVGEADVAEEQDEESEVG